MKSSTASSPRGRLRFVPVIAIEHVWLALALACIGVWIGLVPTPPNDFWWHLKAGQLISTSGLPTTNLFAWSVPTDQPYIYATWLGEWFFFQLYQIGGLGLIAITRNLLGLLLFAAVAWDGQWRSGSWRLAALAALLAFLMSINNLIIRTQNWSWPLFAAYLLILRAYVESKVQPRLLLMLPLLMIVWVNVHGGFVLGPALIGIFWLGETLRRWFKQPRALPWERIRWLGAALGGSLVAMLVNPLGFGIVGYVQKLLTDAPSQRLINEWQPPTTGTLAGMFFFGAVLLLLAALAFARRRPSATDVLLVVVFLWQAWSGQRYVVWFGVVAMPILAQSLAAPRSPLATEQVLRSVPLNTALVAILALLVVLVQPPFKNALPWPASYRALFADVPGAPLTFRTATPVAATEYLRANPRPGRLFAEMGYASYLDWALWPETQVFVDTRIELYPLAIWNDYVAMTKAQNYNALFDKYDIQRLLISNEAQPDLAAALLNDHRWQQEYADDHALVYRRAQ